MPRRVNDGVIRSRALYGMVSIIGRLYVGSLLAIVCGLPVSMNIYGYVFAYEDLDAFLVTVMTILLIIGCVVGYSGTSLLRDIHKAETKKHDSKN